MSTYVVLGATGTVGRELTAALAQSPDSSVFAVSRHRVLLDELAGRLDCTPLSFDVNGGADPRELPEADVLIDLTYVGGRHPRALVRSAEGIVSFLRRYLELHPSARLVHTGTWVATPSDGEPLRLQTRLLWDDTYMLAKSAAERALARAWMPGRMLVIRLGNVLTPDSTWGIGLLRSLRAARVRDPVSLASPAGLSTVAELAEFVEAGSGLDVAQTDAGAGWTWGEVLHAAARRLRLDGVWDTQGRAERATRASSRYPHPAGILNRALWATPLYFGDIPLDRAPIQRVVKALKGIRGAHSVPEIVKLPPGLPAFEPIRGWRREQAALDTFVDLLVHAFVSRGYAS
ncbi:MAG: hypothetical protein ACJ75Z_04175, partial [Solirubrobacterales bacterium]